MFRHAQGKYITIIPEDSLPTRGLDYMTRCEGCRREVGYRLQGGLCLLCRARAHRTGQQPVRRPVRRDGQRGIPKKRKTL